jgi:acyl-coenzyme A synthetase/AMP-(fatty) acid ligase
VLIGALHNGSAVCQPTKPAFGSDELIDMVERCGLNCLRQFGTFLSYHLRAARRNPAVLEALRSLDEAFFCGIGLLPEDEDFAAKNGVNLRNVFGSTEVGAMLYSTDGERFLRQLPGTQYGFWSIDGEEAATSSAPRRNVNANKAPLRELVILGSSADCPDVALRSADGHYHTGDLFQEVQPGRWVFRGRNDDWIKSENSLKCDTKSIEDNVRSVCGDLVEDCVVVGTGRPSPALFIEPAVNWDEERLKREILRRTRPFHARRYLHERIVQAQYIVVVPSKTLPRTNVKGNIRRKAVEETFRSTLDSIYGVQA